MKPIVQSLVCLSQVEALISQHPGISSIVVVGVPDSRLTEMIIACIRLKDGWQWVDSGVNHSAEGQTQCLSSEILRQFCKEKNLTGYVFPSHIQIFYLFPPVFQFRVLFHQFMLYATIK